MEHGKANGKHLTHGCLQPPNTVRWVASRKATLVRGVEAGLLSLDEACSRYSMTAEEFLVWRNRLARHGARGLRLCAFNDQS
jgi:Protein of unknown function (DUF1153)